MEFDICQLNSLVDDEDYELLEKYQEHLIKGYLESAEGELYQAQYPALKPRYWIEQLIYLGYNYIGISLGAMEVLEIEEILTELFPSKITLSSAEEAHEIIPEILSFWTFIQQKYKLDTDNKILNYLKKINDKYVDIMNDRSKFGFAKRLVSGDLSDPFDELEMYRQQALARDNLAVASQRAPTSINKKEQLKKKKLRKLQKASRKKTKKSK
jgi:hypothetical protein